MCCLMMTENSTELEAMVKLKGNQPGGRYRFKASTLSDINHSMIFTQFIYTPRYPVNSLR